MWGLLPSPSGSGNKSHKGVWYNDYVIPRLQNGSPTVMCFWCGETQPMSSIRAYMQQYPQLSDEDFDEIAFTQASCHKESSSSLQAHVC